VALARDARDPLLASQLAACVHLIRLEPPLLEYRPAAGAPRDLSARIAALLSEATGTRWTVAIGAAAGARTLADQDGETAALRRAAVLAHPMVEAIMRTFPGATLEAVHPGTSPADAAPAPPDVDLPGLAANDATDADDPFGDALAIPDDPPDDPDA
jgi:DNA polymerase-3 subunit gamma/tau